MSNKLMLGLWRYVLHVPPFVWQKQIEKGKKRFEKTYGKMPLDFRNVHHFVVRELPRVGKPLSEGFISGQLGLSIDRVRSALDYLQKHMTYLYRNKAGEVIWAYPVTVEKTPHKLAFNTGEKLYAAWAADAFAAPFVQGKLRNESVTVRVETECAHCAKIMEMEIGSNLQIKPGDEACEPVIFVPDVDLSTLQKDSIIDDFWTECVFFWSEEHARAHRKNSHRIRGAYLRVDQMVEVTRVIQSAIFGFDLPAVNWFSAIAMAAMTKAQSLIFQIKIKLDMTTRWVAVSFSVSALFKCRIFCI